MKPYNILLLLALFFAMTTSAQKPLTKPEKPTQTSPAVKSSSGTTSKPSNKSSTTKSSTQSSTSNSAQTSSSTSSQQSQTRNSDSQLQTNKPISGYINGHEWVDLGLSVKWATCNVGAYSPSDYGNYYAWGETRPKSEYTIDNSITFSKEIINIAGNFTYDAARANWGGTWRLPIEAEIDELVYNCEWQWTTQGGHKGYKVTGPNGNSLFLPAAGWRGRKSLNLVEVGGEYWGATHDGHTKSANCLEFSGGSHGRNGSFRSRGQSIRPVSE